MIAIDATCQSSESCDFARDDKVLWRLNIEIHHARLAKQVHKTGRDESRPCTNAGFRYLYAGSVAKGLTQFSRKTLVACKLFLRLCEGW